MHVSRFLAISRNYLFGEYEMRILIKSNGESSKIETPLLMEQICGLLGAKYLDCRHIEDRHILYFDNAASIKNMPTNEQASRLTGEKICGDVAVFPMEDYGD